MANQPTHVVGGGLAGCEAAWQLAQAGLPVILHEMRPSRATEVHQTDGLAELVCSNSFRSDDDERNAVGLLHHELRQAGSLIMAAADQNTVPAGGALAVDRHGFSEQVTQTLLGHPLIELDRCEVKSLPPREWGATIIATGPLTAPALAEAIAAETGAQSLAFFDAIAPIVHVESIDLSVAWFQSRYDKVGPDGNGKDYINCPLNRDQYAAFVQALLDGEKTEFKAFEGTPYFDGCLPIEVMAERGPETLRHGPMKPRGLTNAHRPDEKPYAVLQLRQDNALGTLYNLVGCQTKLRYGEQARIFRTIPGLEKAEFARLGGLHRNTYLNSPVLLDSSLRLKSRPELRFAGQITGCEGYVESAAMGCLAGRFTAADKAGRAPPIPPQTTAFGALLSHITGGHLVRDASLERAQHNTACGNDIPGPASLGDNSAKRSFQPMNVNFGLFPPLPRPTGPNGERLRGKALSEAKKTAMTTRAKADLMVWLGQDPIKSDDALIHPHPQ